MAKEEMDILKKLKSVGFGLHLVLRQIAELFFLKEAGLPGTCFLILSS